MIIKRAFIIVVDACGVGAMPDADDYGDGGAATLPNCAEAAGGLKMPVCQTLGLGNVATIEGVPAAAHPEGAFGRMAEQSAGKDSTTGHWEIGGVITPTPFPTYPDGFPEELVREFERRAGVKTIGNKPASGTVIIEELGEEHLRTGAVILYTSADSVWQMAAHEQIIPVPQLRWRPMSR
jgi:phosphopentomutase